MHLNHKFSFLIIVTLLVGCAPKSAPVEIQPGLQKLEVLHRVQELQRTVIAVHDANSTLLSKSNADIVVKFTLAANDLIVSDSNWQGKVKALWLIVKQEVTPPPSLSTVWAVVDSLIMGLL